MILKYHPMKHLQILCSKSLFLLIFLLFTKNVANAQSYPYPEKWKEIEKKESEGLLKSTKPVVDEIYIQSKKDRLPQQKIKALLYQSKIEIITEEGKQQEAKLHKRFKDEIQAAAGVERSILQSLLAELLNEYFQQHRYQISSRTNEDSTSKNDDFLTWSEANYKKEITTLYSASIDNVKQLQQESIGKWSFILDTAEQYRELRPTVFDMLAHRAISYYVANDEQKRAAVIVDLLLKQHANDTSRNAYLYNSLLGIERKAKAPDDDGLAQLKTLSRLSPEAWYTAEVLLQLANVYQQKLSSEPKEKYAERKRYADSILYICEQTNELYLNTNANKQLQLIKKNILAPEISMQTERFNIPKQSIPVYLAHKNVNKIYVKILKYKKSVSGYLANEFNAWRDIKKQQDVDSLLEIYPEIESYAVTLKKFDDYDRHATIAKFNALDGGAYMALVSNNESFKLDSVNTILFQPINVSINSLVFKEDELLLTDRNSGQPISKSEVAIYEPSGNGKDLRLLEKLITDKNGKASYNKHTLSLNKGSKRWVYQVKGDEVFFDTHQYFYNANNEKQEGEQPLKVQFFIDRGIYRPGQTVYFKGILYKETKGERQAVTGHKTKIHLYDPNNEKIATSELTSNQFGSVFGHFTLPMGKATGRYHLEEEDGDEEMAFRVEEYKRPTFSVVMDTVKAQYKIGDSIIAKGTAQTYSGAVISAAKVNYRVVRNSVYPYRSWLTSKLYFPAKSEEIAIGEANTDTDGRFEIPFRAKAADMEKAGHYRFYNYSLEVSVTDINGETHQGSQTIMVGDKSVMLQISLPPDINIDQLDSISFRTMNLNGQPVSARGNIRLTKLQAPNRILREIPFSETDYILMDSLSYIQSFPHLPFGNEHHVESWPKSQVVMSKDFNSAYQHSVTLEKRKELEAGAYLLEAYVLDGQDTLRTTQIVHAHHAQAKKPVDNEFLRVAALKSPYKPGENAIVMFSSVLPHATIRVELEQNGKIIRSENLTLNNEVKQFEFPIPEQQGDKLFLHYYMGKYNAVESGRLEIAIQQKATDLTITTSTFRDKLQPGKEEMWELNISGPNKDKVFAEVLATMYDASLDQFAQHSLYFPPAFNNTYSKIPAWNTNYAYGINYGSQMFLAGRYNYLPTIKYEDLNHFGFSFANEGWKQRRYLSKLSSRSDRVRTEESGVMDFNAVAAAPTRNALQEVVVLGYGNSEMKQDVTGSAAGVQIRGSSSLPAGAQPLYVVDGEIIQGAASIKPEEIMSIQVLKGDEGSVLYGSRGANGVIIVTTKKAVDTALQGIKVRTNLKETAFFYPDLKTDAEGNIKVHFTTPESLTEWKFMVLAHTATLETGYLEQRVRTSKDLMVVPNAPRFLREGDELVLSTKIINLSDTNLNGAAKLMLFDAYTMQPIDSLYELKESTRSFEAKKGASTSLSWHLKIPATQLLVYRIAATAGNFTDGEEAVLPILPDKMLVTETLPLYAKEGQAKLFRMPTLAKASKETAHARLTLELTSNPMWYAIQALPYLQEYPYDCSEQLFAKLYSALVSKKLMDASPKIKAIFDDWNKKGLLKSKLETNQELKSILLEETPWVREAENEETRMKRLALLFDVNNLRNQWQSTYQQFAARQLSSGGFSWFEGGEASVAITTHIVAGFGHLKNMKIDIANLGDSSYQQVLHKAIQYLDEEALKGFNNKENWSVYAFARYLYARSYFLKEYPLKENIKTRILANLNKDPKKGFADNLQEKAMLSLVYHRYGQMQKSKKIISSLKDYAVNDDEMGMYWKENKSGWNWWQSPIETQAFLIEAFQEVAQDTESVEQMKLWLLKNKQTNHWNSTKATTEAIYALLFTGKDWLTTEDGLEVKLGNQQIDLKSSTTAVGYIKASWEPLAIKPDMAKVEIVKKSPGPVWGGLYWQHFEKLINIKAAATGVQLERTLYLKENTDQGPVLKSITSLTPLKVGDLITVKLIIRADRDLEFVHLKDMRASGFEPVNVLSSFKWQNGLSYYESTRDAATNFFIDRVPKGTYVFEYDVRANNAGKFSNGISSIQSMYAPEMGAHSEGISVNIKEIMK
ncbi:TonB-dependent outer membrane receptor, SusC/RagA subfamily, signature region [Olivibacter domesticus]|uniref:TonB-dependent outer membrane receptor, SusC/RagA subfamily, signature region n=2 Tax=Olivibacter domesticus TaxID=407022 RepID=A0A1H7QV32_OLID1|nr:TonB-dependent outer membrane receptor, SusC/RagA subfamily, signature region [Olivibacter domesticus]